MRTLNDVSISGRNVAVAEVAGGSVAGESITGRYNIGPDMARKGMKIIKANPGRLIAIIRVSGYRFPIQLFSPRQTPEGVEFSEVRGKTSSISHVFTAFMKYGPNVFRRKGEERGPVQVVTGLSVANMVREKEEVLPDMEKRIKEQLTKRAAYWMGEALAGKMAKYGGA